jgi:hypothetical protein
MSILRSKPALRHRALATAAQFHKSHGEHGEIRNGVRALPTGRAGEAMPKWLEARCRDWSAATGRDIIIEESLNKEKFDLVIQTKRRADI